MQDAPSYQITLSYPANAGQAMPPDAEYSRNSAIQSEGKHVVAASSPASYGGDSTRYNPEELMLMSLAQCHMLTYLAIAAKKQLKVLRYEDRAVGQLGVGKVGGIGIEGKLSMQQVTLHPRVTVAKGTNLDDARNIHIKAHANCFMANSVNFPVTTDPVMVEAAE